MRRTRAGKVFSLFLVLVACATQTHARAAAHEERPRVAVIVVVDQLVPEQLLRLEPWLEGGLGRLVARGRFFADAMHDYGNTETAPGHATLATGKLPCHHGIIANQFYDRAARRVLYCVEDGDVVGLCGPSGARDPERHRVSPRSMRALALGDHVRARDERSRAVAIAGKDRSGVLLGGQQPDCALWWDARVGGFASSTWYGDALPEWVLAWNAGWQERASGWEWSPLVPFETLAGSGTAEDDRPGEGGSTRVLPHRLPEAPADAGARAVGQLAQAALASPLGDAFVADLAIAAIDALALGADEHPDVLCLSFSVCDIVGHAHGPTSREVTDVLLRLDRELGRVFERLDAAAGEAGWVACLSSDHGVLDLPESLRARDVDAVRVPGREIGELVKSVRAALAERFQRDVGASWVEGIVLDAEDVQASGLDPEALRAAARDAALAATFVERGFTFGELTNGGLASDDPAVRLAARSTARDRGADVVLQVRPWHLVGMTSGTSHGSPHPYDRRIPIVVYGPRVRPGRSYERASSVDVVPTLLHALGLEVPDGLDGRVLPLE